MLYLVRHAKAGSRRDWDGDDRDRPLSEAGCRQAEQIAEQLAGPASKRSVRALRTSPNLLRSSPYLRCQQTLEPLARRLGQEVEIDERLAEGTPVEIVLQLLGEEPDGTVLCSHGDVIPETISALHRRGCRLRGEPDWRKATVWVVDRRDGEFLEAHVWAPPS